MKSTRSVIERLRHQLRDQEQALLRREELLHQREELDGQLGKLLQEIDSDQRYLQLRSFALNQETLETFQQQLEKRSRLLQQVKQRRQEIDHQLDESEEISPALLQKQRDELTALLVQAGGERAKEFTLLQQELQRATRRLEELETLVKAGERLVSELEAAVIHSSHVTRGGIVGYIIGTSPTQAIAEHLHRAHRIATEMYDRTYERLQGGQIEATLVPLYQQLLDYLAKLQEEGAARWGFKKVRQRFGALLEELKALMTGWEPERKKERMQIEIAQAKMRAWLMDSQAE